MSKYKLQDIINVFNIIVPTSIADREYFETHSETAKELAHKKRLKEIISKFNREQLYEFMNFVITAKRERFLFMSGGSSCEMFADLNELCRKKDDRIPSIYGDMFLEYCRINPTYYFDYLSKRTIAQIFGDHIDKHLDLAVKTAHVFYRSGLHAAYNFMISEIEKH